MDEAQSEAACQQTDAPIVSSQEAPVPAPSAATDSPQRTGTIGSIDTVSGSHNPIIVGSSVNITHYNYPMEGPGVSPLIPQLSQRPDQEPIPSDQDIDSPQRTGTIGSIDTVSGSHNPIIVGSSVKITHYNYQMEGPGIPAPIPQLSQSADQEPRLGAPSHQDVGNKTRDILKTVYKTTGSYVQLLPGVDNDQKHIAGIYTKVQLETREGVAVVTDHQKGETVNSTEYEKIFRLRTSTGELMKRLIVFGMGGVGKTTIFDKIVYDWADGVSEILNRFKLVFLLKMYALSQESDLVDFFFDQLVGEKSGVDKNELDKFILANSNEVLILLDGFDEMKTETLDAALFGSVLKALKRTVYRECFICVSTRPSHLGTLTSKLVQNPCTHVEVLGFTDEDVIEYAQKFYDSDPHSGNALLQTIGKSNTLRDFAKNPMLLLLMSLLWRKNKQLPETTSRLFTEAVNYMFTRKADICDEDASKTVITIGKTALCGLVSANQKFSFQEDEFEPNALNMALKAGILTKQRDFKNLKCQNNIQFMHKTIQEYCAAKYLQSVHISNRGFAKRTVYKVVSFGEFKNSLSQLCQTMESVVSNDFLLRFCCGDNEKCMTDIVNFLDRKFNKDDDKPQYQSDVIQAISRNCFSESQSSIVPQCLTGDSNFSSYIDVRNNKDLRSLIHLLKIIRGSNNRTAQLARVKTCWVSLVSSVSDVVAALGYMENLSTLRLDQCHLVDGGLGKIMSSLKCNQHLTSLDLTGCHTLGGRAVEWAPHIRQLTSLKTLHIRGCTLTGTDIEHIASAARDMPRLTNLVLDGNERLGGSAKLWAKELPKMMHLKLNRLDLSACDLTPKDIKHIASAAGKMPRLTDLVLNLNMRLGGSAKLWAKKLSKMMHLNKLDLGWCDLTPTDMEHIASAAHDMPRLTDLMVLYANQKFGGSAELWAKELPKMMHLSRLDLRWCDLTPKDIEHIASAARDMPRLTDLVLYGNLRLGGSAELWAKELQTITHLNRLELIWCDLTPTDIEHIASVARDMPRLTALDLSFNRPLVGLDLQSRFLSLRVHIA